MGFSRRGNFCEEDKSVKITPMRKFPRLQYSVSCWDKKQNVCTATLSFVTCQKITKTFSTKTFAGVHTMIEKKRERPELRLGSWGQGYCGLCFLWSLKYFEFHAKHCHFDYILSVTLLNKVLQITQILWTHFLSGTLKHVDGFLSIPATITIF